MSDVRDLVFGPCQTCLRPICQCPAKHTPPPDAQAMTREQLEKVVQHHTIGWGPYSKVNPLLEHDAAQRETIRRLEVERDEAWAHHRGHCRIADAYNEEMKTLQARLTASEAKRKWTTARPTVKGQYWWRGSTDDKYPEVIPVFLVQGKSELHAQWGSYIALAEGGEWQGPLTVPGESDEHA